MPPIPYAEPASDRSTNEYLLNLKTLRTNNNQNAGEQVTFATSDTSPHIAVVVPIPVTPGQGFNIEVEWFARDTVTPTNNTGGRTLGVFYNNAGAAAQIGTAQNMGKAGQGGVAVDFTVTSTNVNVRTTGTANLSEWTLQVYVYATAA